MDTMHHEPREIEWPVLCKERVDLRNVVNAAVDACRPELDAHHQTLILRLPPDPMCIEADPALLMQALADLIDNSAKHFEKGEDGDAVVVSAGGTSSEITIRVAGHGKTLGSILAKCIVEMHDGTVEARSASAGLGSTFTVRLPRTV